MTNNLEASLRIGIVSQWFTPEPALIPLSICRTLVGRGHTVRVLTGFPNYPGGKLYAGYENGSVFSEEIDGAEVRRVPSFLSHDQSAVRRVRSFLSFGWSSLCNNQFLKNADVLYVYATPMTAAMAALASRFFRNTPYVLHVQDLWPESVTDSGMVPDGWKKSSLYALINFGLRPIYGLAAHIIVISPGMKEALIARGVPSSKISVLLNWDGNEPVNSNPIDRNRSQPIETRHQDELHCVYAGNIGQMQDVETIVRAVAAVENEFPIRVSIYGSGTAEPALRDLIQQIGVKSVHLMGRVALEEMTAVYQSSDFQFVTLKRRQVFTMTIPSKFQSSMSNGIPIITTVQGDLAKICLDNGVGLVAEAENVESLADALRRAFAMGPKGQQTMSQKAIKLHREKLSGTIGLHTVVQRLTLVAQHGHGSDPSLDLLEFDRRNN